MNIAHTQFSITFRDTDFPHDYSNRFTFFMDNFLLHPQAVCWGGIQLMEHLLCWGLQLMEYFSCWGQLLARLSRGAWRQSEAIFIKNKSESSYQDLTAPYHDVKVSFNNRQASHHNIPYHALIFMWQSWIKIKKIPHYDAVFSKKWKVDYKNFSWRRESAFSQPVFIFYIYLPVCCESRGCFHYFHIYERSRHLPNAETYIYIQAHWKWGPHENYDEEAVERSHTNVFLEELEGFMEAWSLKASAVALVCL